MLGKFIKERRYKRKDEFYESLLKLCRHNLVLRATL